MQVVSEKEKGCHFSNHYFVHPLSLWPASTILAQADMIPSASLGLSSQIPNCIWGAALCGDRRLQKNQNNKPRRSQRVKRERHLAMARNLGAIGQEVQEHQEISFLCHVPAQGTAFAAASMCRWNGPRGRNERHCMQLVGSWDEGNKASEREINQPCGEHRTSL